MHLDKSFHENFEIRISSSQARVASFMHCIRFTTLSHRTYLPDKVNTVTGCRCSISAGQFYASLWEMEQSIKPTSVPQCSH